MSVERYNYLVTKIREVFELIFGSNEGGSAKAAFQIMYQNVPKEEQERLLSWLKDMESDPGRVEQRDGVIPEILIGVSPQLREIRRIVGECVPG